MPESELLAAFLGSTPRIDNTAREVGAVFWNAVLGGAMVFYARRLIFAGKATR